jgi:membrane protein involved in colicin uptake
MNRNYLIAGLILLLLGGCSGGSPSKTTGVEKTVKGDRSVSEMPEEVARKVEEAIREAEEAARKAEEAAREAREAARKAEQQQARHTEAIRK